MSESLEDIKRSRNYQRERVKQVKKARNQIADGLAHWKERAEAAEAELEDGHNALDKLGSPRKEENGIELAICERVLAIEQGSH